MQTLVFNTAKKTAKLYEGTYEKSDILYQFVNVPTVKVVDGYYEVIVAEDEIELRKREPVARFPMASTNMLLHHQ